MLIGLGGSLTTQAMPQQLLGGSHEHRGELYSRVTLG